MEIDCSNCGSICNVVFEEDQTTEDHPLFCPFCGESVDNQFVEDFEDEDDEDYLDRFLEQELRVDEN